MKRTSVLVVSLIAFVTASAFTPSLLEEEKDDSTLDLLQPRRSRSFSPDWFAGLGGGVNMYFGDHNKQARFGDRIAPSFNIYGGKWLNNSFGVRVGAAGGTFKGATQNGAHSTGVDLAGKPQEGFWLEHQKFNYMNFHADLLFNWTNDIFLTSVDHFYNIIPYAGVGVITTLQATPSTVKVSPNVGLLQSVRINDNWDVTLDVRGNVLPDSFDGEKGGKKLEGAATAVLGIKYTFKERRKAALKRSMRYRR